MPFFEDIADDVASGVCNLEEAVFVNVLANYRVVQIEQLHPWTMVKVNVWFNGVKFEGVGFSRQRQYDSIVITRKHNKFCVTDAKRDKWNPEYGKCLALKRALHNLRQNVYAVYRRWASGNKVGVPRVDAVGRNLTDLVLRHTHHYPQEV